MDNFEKAFSDSIDLKKKIIETNNLNSLKIMGEKIVFSIKSGSKILLCGNGGSAADAQHLAAEMLVRLKPHNNREAIPALSLAQDISTITACGNDYGYEFLYERMISGLGKPGDILIGISTSGNSKNVLRAMKKAKQLNIQVFGFLGYEGGLAKNYCDETFIVPSKDVGRIQECHITAGHALMEFIEDKLIKCNFIKLEKN